MEKRPPRVRATDRTKRHAQLFLEAISLHGCLKDGRLSGASNRFARYNALSARRLMIR